MSVLLAALSSVVTTPVPTPSPQVIHEITKVLQPQYVTPDAVVKLFQLFGVMAGGALTSWLHLALERGKLKGNVNRLLVTAYSSGAGALYMLLTGNFGLTAQDLQVGLTALLAFLGSNQGTHMLSEFIGNVMASKTTTDASGAVVPTVETPV